LIHFVLVFPRPLPIINRRRWLVFIPYVALYVLWGGMVLGYTVTTSNKLLWMGWASKASTFVDNVSSALVLVGIIINYRSLEVRSERQQVHLVVLSIILVVALGLVLRGMPLLLLGRSLLPEDAISIIALIIPVTIAGSIQRHQLWALDPIINRTFVYLSLSSIVIGLYMVIVAAAGGLLQTQSAPLGGLIAAGIVAVVFEPLRNRLQRTVNRIMYGERDDPAAVLSQLAHHLETADTPTAILPNLVQTIARALKIPYVAIWLPVGAARTEPVATWGTPAEQMETISLTYQNEAIGHLVVARRGPREQFTRPERDLLATIAALTATTVRAVQLSDELRRSRQRIVSAREEERRRLRRDLHDGLGPQLASQMLGMEAVTQLIPTEPEKAQSLLGSLKAQAQEAILDVRRLVYDLRPPALDDLGLISALRQSASRYETGTLRFSFEVPEELPELPAAVETAVYRIAQEAMTNVVRHAAATRCSVWLSCNGTQIVIEVRDNGRGLPPEHPSGVGLQALRERTTELNGQYTIESHPDGGTLVQARLPLEVYSE
jgi:signal transduction histidine kinase